MDIVIAFIAGGIAFLALAMAIEKAREKKEDDPKIEIPKPVAEITKPLFFVENIGTETVFATVTIPNARYMTGWNTDTIGIPYEDEKKTMIESELKKLLIDELWKFVDVCREENPMDFTTRFKARIRVVKK